MSSIDAAAGVRNAQTSFDLAATRATQAAAGLAAPLDPQPQSPAQAPAAPPELADAMVGLMSAQLAYTASAKVLQMTLDHERSVLDLLA
ncbi:MAG: hypothetical protein V9E83_06220 [Baekduia sp.]